MSTFVLIHGAWHDGSLLEPVATHLSNSGHTVHTPTLAGHGKGADKNVTHNDCVESAIRFFDKNNITDAVLVGHSFAGTIIARLAEEIPEAIRRLVFWNAFVPLSGNSLLDELPPPIRQLFEHLNAESSDGAFSLPFPVWRECFIQDADLEFAQHCYEKLSTQTFQTFAEKLNLERFYASEIPRSFLNGIYDIALPQNEQWGWHPKMSSRLGLARVIQFEGTHEVLFTNPELAAAKIIEAGRD